MNNEPNRLPRFINRRSVVVVLLLITIGFALYWLSSHAFIEITISGSDGGNKYYRMESLDRTIDGSTGANKIKKLVRKGSYQLTIVEGDKNHFSAIETGSFLGTTKVDTELVSEKARSFIGDNPRQCMSYQDGRLYSWQCPASIKDTFVHEAANPSRPSITTALGSISGFKLEGLMTYKNHTHALVKAEDLYGSVHMLYPLDSRSAKLNLDRGRELSSLSGDSTYGVHEYRDGYLLFSHDGDEILYLASPSENPQPIPTPDSVSDNLDFYGIDVKDGVIALTYNQHHIPEYRGMSEVNASNVMAPEFIEEEDEGQKGSHIEVLDQTEVVIIADGQSVTHKLNTAAHQVRLCGKDRLCVLGTDNQMRVYGVAGDSIDEQYRVGGVRQIDSTDSELLLVRSDGVVNFDLDSRSGFFSYRFNGFAFCGLRPAGEDYVLCVQNHPFKQAIIIEQGATITDGIDRKVFELSQHPGVKRLSAYRTTIYISPELGGLEFNQETKEYDYNPEVKSRVGSELNKKIQELGIDREKYTIINTLE